MNQITGLPLWALYTQAFLGPLATVIAAAAAAWVAYRIQRGQLRTAQEKLRHDLFEQILEVYGHSKLFLERVINMSLPSSEFNSVWNEFTLAFRQAKFLFGGDVVDFMEEIRSQIIDLEGLSMTYSSFTEERERQETGQKIVQHRSRLRDAFIRVDEIFMPYLDFRNLKAS